LGLSICGGPAGFAAGMRPDGGRTGFATGASATTAGARALGLAGAGTGAAGWGGTGVGWGSLGTAADSRRHPKCERGSWPDGRGCVINAGGVDSGSPTHGCLPRAVSWIFCDDSPVITGFFPAPGFGNEDADRIRGPRLQSPYRGRGQCAAAAAALRSLALSDSPALALAAARSARISSTVLVCRRAAPA